ncbi:GNAT family N-acetyltransferase [Nocardia terpenica]|uniref:GNAT family N-acetyltransferase n=1 Tax=Nocardia terpenica TaxID=455432 RepID=A0A6G9YWD8_9NOCA|nr:GNAT family N-acetyltransferase [Nocardia terpenica]QIS17538.1 GNAT family N-acetyltransferase [Nocardia terpenica]
MTSRSGITLRSATPADVDELLLLLNASFGSWSEPGEDVREFEVFPVEDSVVALDGDRIVGHSSWRTQTVTVPGERPIEVSTIANAAVAPTHRRRGILRAMYVDLHRRAEAARLPLTMFTASQGAIYGRFGYGPAVTEHRVEIDRRLAAFRPDAPDTGGAELASIPAARRAVPAIYDRWRRLVPGAQQRPDASWQARFDDYPLGRRGGSGLFALLHDDGYALYRYHRRDTGSAIEVVELRAVTPEAHAALWRTLLATELFDRIEATLPPDDQLPYLLTDPRRVRVVDRRDALWLRVMDVPAALTARTYLADLDLVVAVTDPFREAGGTFALRVRDGRADCEPTTHPADIELGIDVLGSLYFGAHRARGYAAAQRLHAKNAAAVHSLDAAFAVERDAELGWFF